MSAAEDESRLARYERAIAYYRALRVSLPPREQEELTPEQQAELQAELLAEHEWFRPFRERANAACLGEP
ncbi:hypothetical protein ACIBEJ_35195 [Nonomuraea sp. NPDC050790]|uniref:hypothetical protein n=1 Tax=Nonomuraea sp. NPDC050790 TaxID=3364371 RepID=UPI0037B143CB